MAAIRGGSGGRLLKGIFMLVFLVVDALLTPRGREHEDKISCIELMAKGKLR